MDEQICWLLRHFSGLVGIRERRSGGNEAGIISALQTLPPTSSLVAGMKANSVLRLMMQGKLRMTCANTASGSRFQLQMSKLVFRSQRRTQLCCSSQRNKAVCGLRPVLKVNGYSDVGLVQG